MRNTNLNELFDENIIGLINKNKLIKHSETVKAIALELCTYNNRSEDLIITQRDIDLIENASLLHDLKKYEREEGKIVKTKNHNEVCADFIREESWKAFDGEDKELICLMVRWHTGNGYKDLSYSKKQIRMIEIVRMADKISKVYKKSKCKELIKVYSIINMNIEKLKDKKVKEIAKELLAQHIFDRLKNLYQKDRISKKDLKKCRQNDLISKKQRKEIKASI